ncbi:hypothetical protein PHYBOEH_007881 [Phytophthora boehmeriae]|uniref:RxLR effector protein n=1 Tax=Phytophthora boehmeriae TaxID=109152 RepID=A0A8T1W4W6_9STRA|nr:hypothetical protein PHYBOEH_007881 [Phytophthora boehmeriae]
MGLTQVLLAATVALVASNDNFAVAGNSTTTADNGDTPVATTVAPEEFYGAVFRVKDGKVTDTALVDINQEDGSVYNRNQMDKADLTEDEERAAVHLPKFMTTGPLHWVVKKIGNLLLMAKSKTKWADKRRLLIEA